MFHLKSECEIFEMSGMYNSTNRNFIYNYYYYYKYAVQIMTRDLPRFLRLKKCAFTFFAVY